MKHADDRENLVDTWQEWVAQYAKTRAIMEVSGLKTQMFNIDVLRVVEHFKQQWKPNTSANRAVYVREITNLFGT